MPVTVMLFGRFVDHRWMKNRASTNQLYIEKFCAEKDWRGQRSLGILYFDPGVVAFQRLAPTLNLYGRSFSTCSFHALLSLARLDIATMPTPKDALVRATERI